MAKKLKCKECGDVTDYSASRAFCQEDDCHGVYTSVQTDQAKTFTQDELREIEDFRVMFGEGTYQEAFICPCCDIENGVGEYVFSTNTAGSQDVDLETEFVCDNCKLLVSNKFSSGRVVESNVTPADEDDER